MGTVAVDAMIDGIPTRVHLYNVHYFPEMTSNLLSLGTLEACNQSTFAHVGLRMRIKPLSHQIAKEKPGLIVQSGGEIDLQLD